MALLLKSGAVFLHVPKTGGTWVADLLTHLGLIEAPLGEAHSTYERAFWHDRFHHDDKVVRNILRRQVGLMKKISPDAFKFCFVREPEHWYVSWWRYMQGQKWRHFGDESNTYRWSPLSALNGLGSPDFNIFVDNVNQRRPGFVTELYSQYVRPGLGFLGRQESLRADTMRALDLMREKYDPALVESFPISNESFQSVPRPEWDPKVRREMLRLEYAGYARYGYPVAAEAAAAKLG